MAIVAAQGEGLCLPLIREALTLLEQAPGQSDLLPLLQQVLDQARR